MNPAIALSIAGSDPSGGAGIQADLKTFTALGVYGAAALAGLTVQNTQGVLAARPVDPDLVHEQIVAVIDDLPVAATKLGMLSDAAVASRVADLLERRRADFGLVILDPVMVATSGDALLRSQAQTALTQELFPLATVVTPNLDEAGWLIGRQIPSASAMEQAAQDLLAMGAAHVLLKGGHLPGETVVDLLLTESGERCWMEAPRIHSPNTHGTGCTLSSAIASNLAKGFPMDVSVERAKAYISGALAAMLDLGKGSGPMNHGFAITGEYAKEVQDHE